MQDLNNYLDSLEKAKGNRHAALNNYNAAKAEYAEAFSPLGGVPSREKLMAIYGLCSDVKGFSASNIFICVALLYYYPEALYGGKIPLRVAKPIAQVLDVTHFSIYIARNKVCSWLRIYPDFFRAVYKVFEQIKDRSIVN